MQRFIRTKGKIYDTKKGIPNIAEEDIVREGNTIEELIARTDLVIDEQNVKHIIGMGSWIFYNGKEHLIPTVKELWIRNEIGNYYKVAEVKQYQSSKGLQLL